MPRQRTRKGNPINGWLVIDKPLGMGSTDVVTYVKRSLRPMKVGHAGTLDPLATGVLPIALGEATKTIPYLVDGRKSYAFTVGWGSATETDDLEGAVVETSSHRPTGPEIEAVLPEFLGIVQQAPPAYSAIKVAGKRSYDLARAGEAITLPERPVRCDQLTLIEATADSATFEVHCGKGFYVRSLGRDLARRLGTVGHILMLRRLHVGPFALAQAIAPISVENSEANQHNTELLQSLLPIEAALDDIPAASISKADAADLAQGRPLELPATVLDFAPADDNAVETPVLGTKANLWQAQVTNLDTAQTVAIAQVRDGKFWPVRVFNLNDLKSE